MTYEEARELKIGDTLEYATGFTAIVKRNHIGYVCLAFPTLNAQWEWYRHSELGGYRRIDPL